MAPSDQDTPREPSTLEIVHAAVERPPDEREAWVRTRCGSDAEMLKNALDLLARFEQTSAQGPAPIARISLSSDEGGHESSAWTKLLGQLESRPGTHSRYVIEGEVARGGMGVVLRAFDQDVRRTLAMKVILNPGGRASTRAAPDDPTLGRFLEEAQVTGQLDHPGIVPVHDIGLDPEGQVYFTMKLVSGQPLSEVIDRLHAGDDGWNLPRVLNLLVRVADAMEYAHRKGVIHRDLKPANVMVGQFGEVYVMDWGLARVGRRTQVSPSPAADVDRSVQTDRRDQRESSHDSPFLTADGVVLGTPAYMPPEQARGDAGDVDALADVYAIGAMLYHVLSGHAPYTGDGTARSARALLARLLDGPPPPLRDVARRAPPELLAICDKAMARDRAARYPSMATLADDLRAYLENRVVRAHATGAVAELRKWIGRNRLAAAAILVAGSSLAVGFLHARAMERDARAAEQTAIAARRDADARRAEATRSAYRANLAGAEAHHRLGEDALARRRLEDCPPAYRGWEWDHLSYTLDASELVLDAGEPVSSLALLPNAGPLVVGLDSGALLLVDAHDGALLHRVDGDGYRCEAIVVHPDGETLFTSRGFSIERRSARTLAVLEEVGLDALTDARPTCFDVGDDGTTLAAGFEDGLVALWDLAAREVRWRRPLADETDDRVVLDVDLAPDGVRLYAAVGTREGRCVALDTHRDEVLFVTRWSDARDVVVGSVACHPQGRCVAVGFGTGECRLVDATTGAPILRWPRDDGYSSPDMLDGLRFDPRGLLLVGAGDRHDRVPVWDLWSGALRAELCGHEATVEAVAFDADGRLITGSWDGTVRRWDPSGGPARDLPGGFATPPGMSNLQVARADVQMGMDEIFARTFPDGPDPRDPANFPTWGTTDLAFDPGGGAVITSNAAGVSAIDLTSGGVTAIDDVAPFERIAFAATGDRAVTSQGTDVRVIEWPSGRTIRSMVADAPAWSLAISADGRQVAAGGADGVARVWPADGDGPPRDLAAWTSDTLDGLTVSDEVLRPVTSVAFDDAGRRLLTAGSEAPTIVWDLAAGEERLEVPAPERDEPFDPAPFFAERWSARFGPGEATLLLARGTDSLEVRATSDGELVARLQGHSGVVTDVALSPDGTRVFTAGEDRTMRIWTLDGPALLRTFHGGAFGVGELRVSPDGRRVAALGVPPVLWSLRDRR